MKYCLIDWEYDNEKNIKQFTAGVILRHKGGTVVERKDFHKFQKRDLVLSSKENPEEYVKEHKKLGGVVGVIPHEEGYEIIKMADIGRDFPIWWSIKAPNYEENYEENVTDIQI